MPRVWHRRWPFRKVKKIDMLIKQLEEEKEKVVSSPSVSGKEEELSEDLKNNKEKKGEETLSSSAPSTLKK